MVFQKTSSMPFFFKSSTIFEPKKLKEPQASHKNLTLTPAAARSAQTSIRRSPKSSITKINVSKTIDFSARVQSAIMASQASSLESYIFQLVSGLGIQIKGIICLFLLRPVKRLRKKHRFQPS